MRSQENREQRLGSYELFQRGAPREHAVWDKMMRGLSTRNYGAVVKEFREAYGVEKSAVSDSFIEASREKLQELMERPLGELRLCAVLIDGTPFRDRQMMVALGISTDGRGATWWTTCPKNTLVHLPTLDHRRFAGMTAHRRCQRLASVQHVQPVQPRRAEVQPARRQIAE